MKLLVKVGFIRNSIKSKFHRNYSQKFRNIQTSNSSDVVYSPSPVVLDTISGYLFDSNGIFISDSTSWAPEIALERMPAKPIFPRFRLFETGLNFLSSEAYYHWLIEDFPSFLRILSIAPNAVTGIRQNSPSYVSNALDLLGIKPVVLPLYVKTNSLLLTIKGPALHPQDRDVKELEKFAEKVLGQPIDPFRKIYVSRRDSGRFPLNELQVEKVLISAGFEIVLLSKLHLEEQIRLFSESKIIVGTHGAGLANVVWCQSEKSCLLEISTEDQPRCFQELSQLKRVTYKRLESKNNVAWEVDLALLQRLLENL